MRTRQGCIHSRYFSLKPLHLPFSTLRYFRMSGRRGASFFFSLMMMMGGPIAYCGLPAYGQSRVQDRIVEDIDTSSTAIVKGSVHPLANVWTDQGTVSPSFPMEHVTIIFKRTNEQRAVLNALLERQYDPASPDYHRWLSPEQFADRFGLSENDVKKIVAWLENQGFTVSEIGRNRSYVTFTGSAGQVETSLHTSIHHYNVNGRLYYANEADPSVPAVLADLVLGFSSLNNFRLKPKVVKRDTDAAAAPEFTSTLSGNNYMTPSDFTTIYDLGSLYSSGLDGTGQTIAVAGQTDIHLNDIEAFRTASGLPLNDPEVILVPGISDPGVSEEDLVEADLDLEWAGAVAPQAHVLYIVSNNALVSLQYSIDQNLAPVVSISYGNCEQNFSAHERDLLFALGQQANAQGITIVAASGDNGAADCEPNGAVIATHGLAVDMPASLPYVTGVGGSEFHDTAASWSITNNGSNGSALSYIPEVAWNDTSRGGLAAGGGGRSSYFPKPSWQRGSGVPNDASRDVPDISLSASAGHDGYLICSAGSCVNGYRSSSGGLTVVGGTSIGAPSFAGIVALINQKAGSPQGNVNSILYALAAAAPAAFHDITSGGNQTPCNVGTPDCGNASVIGYAAGPGYDQATGLGSVDVSSLLASWPTPNSSQMPTAPPSGSSSNAGSPGQNTTTAPQPIPIVQQSSIHSGYIIITPDSGSASPAATVTFGLVNGSVVQSQTDATPTPIITDASFYADVVPGIGRNLGIAIVNSGSTLSTITLTLRDANGKMAGNPVTLSLAPQQQIARFVNELFSSTLIGSTFFGSLRVQSSSPVSMLGLRFAGACVSAPPFTVSSNSANGSSIVFPQFAMGGGWATQVALVNNNGGTISGRIEIYDPSGKPMAMALNGVTQSSFNYSIPASGTFVLGPRDANDQTPF